jgi:hypothetical protein
MDEGMNRHASRFNQQRRGFNGNFEVGQRPYSITSSARKGAYLNRAFARRMLSVSADFFEAL